MPRSADLPAHLAELAYRNAAEVRSGRDFSFHVNRLITAIADLRALPQEHRPLQGSPSTPVRLSLASQTLADNPESLIGIQLGAFIIERLLAVGGSGVSYVGRNPRTGQHVCVKVSLPVLSDMEGIRRSLSRGIRGLVALNHPHIVRVHEFDGLELADAQSFYVVMDYVEGVLLNQWANALPPNRDGVGGFIRVAFLIARALEAAHAGRYLDDAGFETVGVMHGDIKPGNILVRADGTPALTDFMMVDVQRALDPAIRERLANRADTRTMLFGTPGFMAPEQEREGIVTVRTDVYGLGATLRVAASGISLPPDLISLIGRMTGPVTGRPQDMGEVARVLSDVARREGLDCEEMRREQPEDLERVLALRVHRAYFGGEPPECYFINLTNLSPRRALEITHIWYEDETHHIPVIRASRPLPVRIDVDRSWETWITSQSLPPHHRDDACRRFRARISTGTVFASQENPDVPPIGTVPGGPVR
jgi:serine/threonine protein kinase